MQFGDARAFIMGRAYEPFLARLAAFGIDAVRVVHIFDSTEAWCSNCRTAVSCVRVAREMFQFLTNLCTWLRTPNPGPDWATLITQQRDRYLAFLEGMGCELWPAVHHMLHHTADVFAHHRRAPYFFLEEAYKAAHHQDRLFSELTPHARGARAHEFNTWELILRHNAVWASLTANGTISRRVYR